MILFIISSLNDCFNANKFPANLRLSLAVFQFVDKLYKALPFLQFLGNLIIRKFSALLVCLWPICHSGQTVTGQTVTLAKVSLAKMSPAKVTLAKLSLRPKCPWPKCPRPKGHSGQSVILAKVSQPKCLWPKCHSGQIVIQPSWYVHISCLGDANGRLSSLYSTASEMQVDKWQKYIFHSLDVGSEEECAAYGTLYRTRATITRSWLETALEY